MKINTLLSMLNLKAFMNKTILTLSLFILLLSSCRKDFKFNDSEDKQVNVMCFLKADDTIRVHLSYTYNPYKITNENFDPYIKNAKVFIYENNQLKEELTYYENNFNGWYLSENFIPIIGEKYKLKVVVPNYDTIYAETEIPYKTLIDTITYNLNIEVEDDGEYSASIGIFDFILSFTDPSDYNYYSFNSNIIYKTSDPIFETRNSNGIYINNNYSYKPYFSDSIINGQKYNLKYNANFLNLNLIDTFYFSHELISLSKDAYLFYKTRYLQYKNKNNPLVEPVLLHSNITNGTGIFAGIATDIDTIIYIKNQ